MGLGPAGTRPDLMMMVRSRSPARGVRLGQSRNLIALSRSQAGAGPTILSAAHSAAVAAVARSAVAAHLVVAAGLGAAPTSTG